MSSIVEQILATLFEPETRRLKASLDNLINRHSGIVNKGVIGFLFNGTFYCHSNHSPREAPLGHRERLADELTGPMEAYLADVLATARDRKIVQQTLHVLTKNAVELQEFRDALPDFISCLVPELLNLRRINSFDSIHSPRTLSQTAKTLEKVYVYAAGRFLY